MTKPTVRMGSNEVCHLWKGDQFLRGKCLYLKRSGMGCKKFQRVQLLLVMTEPTVRVVSNELCLSLNRAHIPREKCLYLKRSGMGCKKFQRVHSEQVLTNFQVFEEFYYKCNFYLWWANLLSKLAQMNCASLERMLDFLEKNVVTWNDLLSAVKSCNECTPNHFWQVFNFLRVILRI